RRPSVHRPHRGIGRIARVGRLRRPRSRTDDPSSMTSVQPNPEVHARGVGLDPTKLPRHIAIIMDGNGRWARAQGKERVEGHARGAKSVDVVTEECCRLGIGQLTLYCLSSENWKRPKPEIDFLMALLKEYLLAERTKILEQNIRFTVIGRREGLP